MKKITFFYPPSKGDLRKICEKIQTDDPTFEYEIDSSYFSNTLGLNYYYKGINNQIEIYFKDKQFKIEDEKHNDLEILLQSHFKKIEKKVRIKNLYEPPKEHFKKMLACGYSFSEREVEILYEKLSVFYPNGEVEKKAAIYYRENGPITPYHEVSFNRGHLPRLYHYFYDIFDYTVLKIKEIDIRSPGKPAEFQIGTKEKIESEYM